MKHTAAEYEKLAEGKLKTCNSRLPSINDIGEAQVYATLAVAAATLEAAPGYCSQCGVVEEMPDPFA